MILRLTLFSLFPRLFLSESGFMTSKQGPFPFLWQPVRDVTYIYAVLLGTVSREKTAVHIHNNILYTDMEFVKKFTPPDFQAKNFTPSISPNFNSFSKKKHKK